MAVTTVYNNIDRVAGDPFDGIAVEIALTWDQTVSPVARDIDDETMVRGLYGATTNTDGFWSAKLVPNDEITPAGSLYKVTEAVSTSDEAVYYIDVPGAATPQAWTGSLLVSTPAWEED